jgi:hypothetical protein
MSNLLRECNLTNTAVGLSYYCYSNDGREVLYSNGSVISDLESWIYVFERVRVGVRRSTTSHLFDRQAILYGDKRVQNQYFLHCSDSPVLQNRVVL